MGLSLPRKFVKKIWRAVIEFDLIEPHDKIMIGFSGGKDSALLAYALSVLSKSSPVPFEVEAVHIDLGFDSDFDFDHFYDFFEKLDIPFHIEHTRIQEIVFKEGEKSACARCAYFRRGAINNYVKERGFNKLAYAHHYDDAVETFLMSILYSAQVSTFQPKSYLSRKDITVIRPMVYVREKEVREAKKFMGYEPIVSPCPMDGNTKREEVKNLIRDLTMTNKQVFYNVASAMCEDSIGDMWPERVDGEDYAKKAKAFWAAKYQDK